MVLFYIFYTLGTNVAEDSKSWLLTCTLHSECECNPMFVSVTTKKWISKYYFQVLTFKDVKSLRDLCCNVRKESRKKPWTSTPFPQTKFKSGSPRRDLQKQSNIPNYFWHFWPEWSPSVKIKGKSSSCQNPRQKMASNNTQALLAEREVITTDRRSNISCCFGVFALHFGQLWK